MAFAPRQTHIDGDPTATETSQHMFDALWIGQQRCLLRVFALVVVVVKIE